MTSERASLDPMAIDRLKRWRSHGDGPVTYTAGSKQFGDDVIVLLDDIERLRAALIEIRDFPYVGAQASAKIYQIAQHALA